MTQRQPVPMGWLSPIRASLSCVGDGDWWLLVDFAHDLADVLALYPDDPSAPQQARSARLLQVKRVLAGRGYGALDVPAAMGGRGRHPVLQALVQFICGYHDLDLRDAATIGHGKLLTRHGVPDQLARWLPRLLAGGLCGIAMTELHGGTQIHATTATLTPSTDGMLRLDGHKCHVSRLLEADVFVILCRHATEGLTTVLVDPTSPGVTRHPTQPAGLRGWTWGVLRFNRAPIHPNDLLGTLGAGATLCAEHFAAFRPLVAATALGGAASVVDQVLAGLRQRLEKEYIRIPRDSALTTLGRHVAAVNADLLACLANTRLAAAGDPAATAWGLMTKAHGVDTAHRAAAEVGLIAGALGFEAGHPIAKVRRDLEGLQYADGIHEELYRAAGRSLLNATRSARLRTRRPDRQRGAVSHGATALTTH